MAQQVKAILELENGKKIERYHGLVISQDLFRHHQFQVSIPFDGLEEKEEVFFHSSYKNVCGKSLSISFEAEDGKKSFEFRFKGIITEIILSNQSDFSNVFLVKGYSATRLLDDCSLRRSFINKSIQQIFDIVLSDYPGNIIKKKLKPQHKNPIAYAVQYDETNFDFLSRIAAEYGEWFFYNGKEIILGEPDAGKEFDFVLDGNQSFDMSISLTPAKFSMVSYDYGKDEFYKGKSGSQSVAGLNQFGKFALDESENLFGQEALLVAAKPVYNQNELDEMIRYRRSCIASNLVVFHGRGENPDLGPGSVINVSASRAQKGGRSKQESIGKYRITEIELHIDRNGNYSNSFKAVPETAKFPPRNPCVVYPAGQPELATVINNDDPDKMGRVKVSFNWPGNDKESDWIRVGSFYSGGDDRKGMQFIPEKDAQVMVGYEGNQPECPFIFTSLYPKKDGMRYRKGNNDEKLIYTKAGNLIELIDKQDENLIRITNINKDDTSITLEFKQDGKIILQTDGKVDISAGDSISFSAKNISFSAKQDFEIEAGKNISIKANAKTEIKATASASISSANTEVSGDAMTTIKGTLVKIN